nr:putative reverse transcriptase domain-containing protein [Tanacetum cinerariifolium]
MDLHPCLPDPGFTMDHLPGDAIGIYFKGWFSFSKHHNTKDVCMDDGPLSLKKWKNKFFLIDRRAIPDYLTWRHSCSCVLDDLPTDDYDRNDVERLQRVQSHTTALTTKSALISLPTLDEIAASLLDPRLAKKSRVLPSLKRDECTSTRAASALTPHLGKRLGAPLSMAVVSAFRSSHVGTSTHASTSGLSFSLGGVAISSHAGKSKAEVVQRQMNWLDSVAHSALACDVEYDQILEDDFGTTTRGEEIDLTLFPLPPALDWTITPVELKRTKSLLLLDLSNRFNVLSALLVSNGAERNSRYTGLVRSRNRLQDKFDRKDGYIKVLRSEVMTLDGKLERMQKDCDALVQENRELCSQKDVAPDMVKDLHTKLTDARITSIERGLRMGCTDAEFEVAAQKLFIEELLWEVEDFVLPSFLWRICVFLSFAPVNAYYFIQRFKFSLSASSFCSSNSWITRLVEMPISAVAVIMCLYVMWYAPWLCDQLESFMWYASWLCDQLESFMWYAPWLCDQLESFMWYAPWLCDQLESFIWYALWLCDQLESFMWPMSFGSYGDERVVGIIARAAREVQGRSGVKRKLFGSCRNNMGNEPIFALLGETDNFVVMWEARVKIHAWIKSEGDCIYVASTEDSCEERHDSRFGIRKCRSPVLWAKIGKSSLIGPELVLEKTDKVVLIKETLKEARDRQKSYADKRRKLLEFEVGDRVLLKVSPWRGVVRFRKKGRQDTLFCRGTCRDYRSRNRKLKRKLIALVKVRWNSKRGPEFTWEHEDQMRIKYLQLLMDRLVKPAS